MTRLGCSYHCRACDACFSSLEAFDAHRQFAEGHQGDWDHRVCIEPMDDARFGLKTGDGVCNLARPKKFNTRIWQLAAARERWAKRSAPSRVTEREPESDLDHPEAA